METRFLLHASRRLKTFPLGKLPPLRHSTSSSSSTPSTKQANPIGGYYASILEFSSQTIASKPPTTIRDSAPETPAAPAETAPEPSILFSSRLSSPLERRNEIQRKSTLVAGIWVPPRPDEPENCCMSGCVNCVWDRYGEELEEWALKRKEADAALKEKEFGEGAKRRHQATMNGREVATGPAASMEDDGGGSETNWSTGLETSLMNDDLFKGVPVGIREFIKQEKKLKERHAREGTSGG